MKFGICYEISVPLPARATEAGIRYTAGHYLLDPDKPALAGTEVLAA